MRCLHHLLFLSDLKRELPTSRKTLTQTVTTEPLRIFYLLTRLKARPNKMQPKKKTLDRAKKARQPKHLL